MVRLFAVLIVLALPFGPAAASDDVRPYDGYLPTPGWTYPSLLGRNMRTEPAYYAVRVVDDRTQRPIAGATLKGYVEDTRPAHVDYGTPVCRARTDADGIAWVRPPAGKRVEHWLVQAKGYAPQCGFGFQPDPDFPLSPSEVDVSGQLADVFGVPLAGAQLELSLGCPHGPGFARVVADETGRVRLTCDANIVCVPSRGRTRSVSPHDLAWAAARGRPLYFEPGRTLHGRVVDAKGRPVVGAVVRSTGWHAPYDEEGWRSFERAPIARTDANGAFVLRGVQSRDHQGGVIIVSADGAQRAFRELPPTRKPRLDVVLAGLSPAGVETGTLVLRPVDPAGTACAQLPRLHAVRADGTTKWLDVDAGVENALPPGRWHVAPASAFAATTFESFHVDIVAGWSVERNLTVAPQPRAALAGEIADHRELTLATVDERLDVTAKAIREGGVHVPRSEAVALYDEDHDVHVLLRPASAGRRTARVDAPRPTTIKFKAPFEVTEAYVLYGGAEVDAWPGSHDTFRTQCRGDVVVRVRGEERFVDKDVPLRIDRPGGTVVVDVRGLKPLPDDGEVQLTYRLADGTVPEEIRYVASYPDGGMSNGGASSPDTLLAPCRVRLWSHTLAPIEADLQPGERELVWPPHSLVLEAFDPEGHRVPCVVMVDGRLYRGNADTPFRLGGLPGGRHRVIVTPFDLRWRGVQMNLELGDGETRRRVDFTAR